ncbi:unnamed protein product [Brassica oleracea var. botrytis]
MYLTSATVVIINARLSLPSLSLLSNKTLICCAALVASDGLAALAAAGCLSSFSLFSSPPLSRLLLPLFSSADILTVVVSLSSWCRCPVIWPDLITKVSDGVPVVVLWVTGVSSGVMRGGWLRSQFWISSGCSGGGGDSLLAVVVVVLGLQSRWQRVLLAPLQIGCSSAVPCPVVLASLSRAESGGCGFGSSSPPRCSPIVVYCDSVFLMVSSHQQVVGLCSKAIFWRRVPGQAIIYRLVLICLLLKLLILRVVLSSQTLQVLPVWSFLLLSASFLNRVFLSVFCCCDL